MNIAAQDRVTWRGEWGQRKVLQGKKEKAASSSVTWGTKYKEDGVWEGGRDLDSLSVCGLQMEQKAYLKYMQV